MNIINFKITQKCFSNGLAVTKKFYESAFEHYQRARGLLDTRDNNSDLWDLVTWELSTSKFTLAQQLFDCYIAGEQVSTFFSTYTIKTKHCLTMYMHCVSIIKI